MHFLGGNGARGGEGNPRIEMFSHSAYYDPPFPTKKYYQHQKNQHNNTTTFKLTKKQNIYHRTINLIRKACTYVKSCIFVLLQNIHTFTCCIRNLTKELRWEDPLMFSLLPTLNSRKHSRLLFSLLHRKEKKDCKKSLPPLSQPPPPP